MYCHNSANFVAVTFYEFDLQRFGWFLYFKRQKFALFLS